MFKFFKKTACMSAVSTIFQTCGMPKEEARYLVYLYPDVFTLFVELTKNITAQQRNLIAAISYLDLIKSIEPEFPANKFYKEIFDAIRFQLIASNDWENIGRTFSTVRHIVNGEDIMSDSEVDEAFNPIHFN